MRRGEDPDVVALGHQAGEASHRCRPSAAVQQQERSSFTALLYDQVDLARARIRKLVCGQSHGFSFSLSFPVAFLDFFGHLLKSLIRQKIAT
jgi:hypothetical protein